jgi:hypothetical protein
MKKLSIEERVDRLLKEGIDNPKKWAAVHGYEEPVGDACDFDWYEEWKKLRNHHLEETNFLFDVIRELTKRIQ